MRKTLCLIILGCTLAGCSPDTPAAIETPVTASPASSSEASADPSTDPLYLEAVEVYKKFFAEMASHEARGYPETTPPTFIDKYLAGSLKTAVSAVYMEGHQAAWTLKDEKPAVLTGIAPNPGTQRDGSLISIRLCTDGTKSTMLDAQGTPQGTGALIYKVLYFKKYGASLKAFLSEAKEVEKCPV